MRTKLFIVKNIDAWDHNCMARIRAERLICVLIEEGTEIRVERYYHPTNHDIFDFEITVKDFPDTTIETLTRCYRLYDLLYDGRWQEEDFNRNLHADH